MKALTMSAAYGLVVVGVYMIFGHADPIVAGIAGGFGFAAGWMNRAVA